MVCQTSSQPCSDDEVVEKLTKFTFSQSLQINKCVTSVNQQKNPDSTKVQQTVSESRRHRRELELASLELEELISQLEQDNRRRRSKYLVNLFSNQ
jgi:hypothetical protein